MATKSLSFSQFGQSFIQSALSPTIIGAKIAAAVKGTHPVEFEKIVTFQGVFSAASGAPIPMGMSDTEITLKIPLTIYLDLTSPLGGLKATVATQLTLTGTCRAPLTIKIAIAEVAASDLKVTSSLDGILGLIPGLKEGAVRSGIQEQVAQRLKAQFEGMRGDLEIDVLAMIQKGAAPGPVPGSDPANALILKRGGAVKGELQPGQKLFYQFPKGDTDSVDFGSSAVFRGGEPPEETVFYVKIVLPDGSVDGSEGYMVSAEDPQRHEFSYTNVQSYEDYRVCLENKHKEPKTVIEFTLSVR